MALTLSAFNIGTQTFSVCANLPKIAWRSLINYGGEYTLDTNPPLAEHVNCDTSFQWDVGSFCTSAINISSTVSDLNVITLCAYNTLDETISGLIELTPSHAFFNTSRVDDRSVSATAFYQQVSTLSLSTIPPNYQLIWSAIPETDELWISYGGNRYSLLTPVTALYSDVSTVMLSTNQTSNENYTVTLEISGSLFTFTQYGSSITLGDSNIIVNDNVQVQEIQTLPDRIILSAYQYNTNVNPAYSVQWNITPNTGNETLSAIKSLSAIVINSTTSALCADYIEIITTDKTNEYVYSLNTYAGVASGYFRPYIDLTSDLALTASVSTINDNQQSHQYYLQIHGLSSDIAYNLNDAEYLIVQNTSNDSGVFATKNDQSSYNFDSINSVANIDELYLNIIPNVTTTYPKLCAYSFAVCALSGSTTEEALINTTFVISATEWLETNIFNPAFALQCESSSLITTYRPLTSGNYILSSHSILPANSMGNLVFTFDDGVVTVPYDITTGGVVTGTTHVFDGTVPVLCTINLTVYASAAGYTDYVIRSAITKYLQFTRFPTASTFIVYPEFTWNGLIWEEVVQSQQSNNCIVLKPQTTLSAYDFSHTENFFVSCQATSGTVYKWDIQNLNGSGNVTTTFSSNTGWITRVSPAETGSCSVCAAIFNSTLPSTMPAFYYDTSVGQKYPNFSSTFDTPTAYNRKHIDYYGINTNDLRPVVTQVDTNPAGIPAKVYLTGGYVYSDGTNHTPFNFEFNVFSCTVSSNYNVTNVNAALQNSISATNSIQFNVDDIGSDYLTLPKYDVNKVDIYPTMTINPKINVQHPSANDWDFSNIVYPQTVVSMVSLQVYPMLPLIYTPNRYVISGTNVRFENLVNCFSGVQDFIWNDRRIDKTVTTCVPYVTNYNTIGSQDITLTVHFSSSNSEIIEDSTTFSNIVNVQSEYTSFDTDISRIYNVTILDLPYDINSTVIGTNDLVTADTFNNCIRKLEDNLTYLKNKAKMYDNPPTEYFGWLGSLSYANSSKHFRWFVNSSNISYAYDEPNLAIDDVLNNLTDIFVRNNIMYVSTTTDVSVLSSNFKPTIIGTRSYKTIGDNFTDVKAVQLDTDDRVYILEGNRINVFDFNINDGVWVLLYGWGGLGGATSKTKLNNPNDFYIDKNNNIWVADTTNNVIKKYTRTGSWLQTIESINMTAPLSVVLDEDNNIHVLTTSSVIKFDPNGNYLSTRILNNNGAKKIRECKDNGFGYICYTDKIVKYMYVENNQAIFANNDHFNYTKDYRNVYHDEFRNLYVVAKNHILKYVDKLSLISVIQDTEGKTWPIDHLIVAKDEYQQDWVYNRCFNRMYDNIEILRKSILGKFDYTTTTISTTATVLSSIPMPDDIDLCNTDWLFGNGVYVDLVTSVELVKPCVRSFTISEYHEAAFTKDEIFIGLNEFVSAPVINRCISKLLTCQEVIKDMLT